MQIRVVWVTAILIVCSRGGVRAQRVVHTVPAADKVPTLIVFITVDQMREDYLDRFQPQLTRGLARLSQGGAFFTNAFQDHATTETAPGHASTMSGRFPSHTGISRNSAGVQDPQSPYLGDPKYNASPFRFRGGTLTDWLRIKDARTRALSVSRKDRGAIFPVGRAKQSVYWYDPAKGRFTTSSYYADTLPTWLSKLNARAVPAGFAGKSWALLLPADSYPEPDNVPEEANGKNFLFPHVAPSDSAAMFRALPGFPFMDELTLRAASEGLRAMRLGTGPQTDVLAISLSATDEIGHNYGMESRELHDQILRLDRMLGAFLDTLFTIRDSTRVVIALTGDHGVTPTPELYAKRTHRSAPRVDLSSLATRYRMALAARGVDSSAFELQTSMLDIDRAAFARVHVSADSVVGAFAAEAIKVPGVLRADRVSSLARDSVRDPYARRWVHSIPADSKTALVISLRPHSVWGSSSAGEHGTPSDDDAHVPVIFWGAPFKAGRYSTFARTVDMAPTLAWVALTPPTEKLDGVVLWQAIR
ncbi:MAG: alkaline phosphatase family protein [Gemmatimonadaceae bacterium]|nr:alkaline phosphatase family protein [Gemmatimonadaceae bacterium]